MSKKKPTLYKLMNDDSLWGNQETDALSHDELMDRKWLNRRTSAEKEQISRSKCTITKEQADEIWDSVWGEDRGYPLFNKLAKKYKCAPDATSSIAHNSHFYSTVTDIEYKQKLDDWNKQFGHKKQTYILRSPGNDLLDYYDEMNSKRGTGDISKIPPSVVFHCRFNIDNEQERLDYMWQYCQQNNVKIKHKCDCKRYLNTFKWLVDKPHTSVEFNTLPKMSKYICELSGRTWNSGGAVAFDFLKSGLKWYDRKKSLPGYVLVKE